MQGRFVCSSEAWSLSLFPSACSAFVRSWLALARDGCFVMREVMPVSSLQGVVLVALVAAVPSSSASRFAIGPTVPCLLFPPPSIQRYFDYHLGTCFQVNLFFVVLPFFLMECVFDPETWRFPVLSDFGTTPPTPRKVYLSSGRKNWKFWR